MARPADLAGFARRHCLRTLTIAELVRYRSLQQQHSGRARPIRAIAVNK
jgi:hypothetical protein